MKGYLELMFTCGYCGKPYNTIEERMECEKSCREKKIRNEENAKVTKRNEEMKKDYTELDELIKERDKMDLRIQELRGALNKKYYGDSDSSLNALFEHPYDWFFRF